MRKYEDGLPPVNQIHLQEAEKLEEGTEETEPTVEVSFEMPASMHREYSRIATNEGITLQLLIIESMEVRKYIADLQSVPGTTIVERRSNKPDREILFVLIRDRKL